ncbi:hypothetical protein AB0J71_32660 [Nonomuraea sp. NPDC049637]|uniref:hypothetical protein n=1 Tax=Nonomuraea sp. NPDC049637 TaxID=3154356 RepID=UPI00341E6468
MNARRTVILVTAALVVIAAVVLAVLRWDDANKLASSLSALAGLAAVGVGIYAALPSSARTRVRVSRTGRAVANGGTANTGVSGTTAVAGEVQVDHTGDARASGRGDANTGLHLD